MRNFRYALLVLALAAPLWLVSGSTRAQGSARGSQALITSARVEEGQYFYGPVYVTIGGKERKIDEEAGQVWVIEGGRRAVYSGRDGSGGFENEGQSLRVYDSRTGKIRKVMSEYVGITDVKEVKTSRGKTALLVEMADGGLGGSYLAVVDPDRGEVFYLQWAKLLSRRGDQIVVGFYKEDDWPDANEDSKIRPYKTARYNLTAILKRRVIYNKPDR